MYRKLLVSLFSMLALTAVGTAGADPAMHPTAAASQAHAAAGTEVVVYKAPTCGCCESWSQRMKDAGFKVKIVQTDNLMAEMHRLGVPMNAGSCHTATVGGYFIEGHVPPADVKRLLAEHPNARGLAVPGMVPGSPGMEQGGIQRPYDVLLVGADGSTSVFAHYDANP